MNWIISSRMSRTYCTKCRYMKHLHQGYGRGYDTMADRKRIWQERIVTNQSRLHRLRRNTVSYSIYFYVWVNWMFCIFVFLILYTLTEALTSVFVRSFYLIYILLHSPTSRSIFSLSAGYSTHKVWTERQKYHSP